MALVCSGPRRQVAIEFKKEHVQQAITTGNGQWTSQYIDLDIDLDIDFYIGLGWEVGMVDGWGEVGWVAATCNGNKQWQLTIALSDGSTYGKFANSVEPQAMLAHQAFRLALVRLGIFCSCIATQSHNRWERRGFDNDFCMAMSLMSPLVVCPRVPLGVWVRARLGLHPAPSSPTHKKGAWLLVEVFAEGF